MGYKCDDGEEVKIALFFTALLLLAVGGAALWVGWATL